MGLSVSKAEVSVAWAVVLGSGQTCVDMGRQCPDHRPQDSSLPAAQHGHRETQGYLLNAQMRVPPAPHRLMDLHACPVSLSVMQTDGKGPGSELRPRVSVCSQSLHAHAQVGKAFPAGLIPSWFLPTCMASKWGGGRDVWREGTSPSVSRLPCCCFSTVLHVSRGVWEYVAL